MAFELKQNLKLSQQLIMTPQLQQAIKLLQLSRQELVEAINQEMEENPLLEEASPEEQDTTDNVEEDVLKTEEGEEAKGIDRTEELTGEGDGKDEFASFGETLLSGSPAVSQDDRAYGLIRAYLSPPVLPRQREWELARLPQSLRSYSLFRGLQLRSPASWSGRLLWQRVLR